MKACQSKGFDSKNEQDILVSEIAIIESELKVQFFILRILLSCTVTCLEWLFDKMKVGHSNN